MTTINIKSINPAGGGDYLTLAAWDAARRGNLVGDDRVEIAEVYGGGSVGGVSLLAANWTVDATRYPIIRAASGHGHAGVYDASKAVIGDGTGATQLSSNLAYLDVYQMQVYPQAVAGGVDPIAIAPLAAGTTNIDRCILRGGRYLFSHDSAAGSTVNLRNCSCYGQGNSNAAVYAANATTTNIYNCVIIAKGRNIYVGHAATTVTENNNYLLQVGADLVYFNMGGTLNKGANTATNNAEATTVALRNIPYTVANFINVTGGTEDHHLQATSVLVRAGATIPSVTEDIDGDARFAGFYDIGCDQESLPVNRHNIDDALLRDGNWNYEKYNSTIVTLAANAAGHPYVRLAINPKDDSSASPEMTVRRVRDYYTIPPAQHWHNYRLRCDCRVNNPDYREDGFRWYQRLYKEAQEIYVQCPCVAKGSLIPVSFVHPDEPKASETMAWANACPMNAFRVKFTWQPSFTHVDNNSLMELIRIGSDANNYIVLYQVAQPTNELQREYNVNDVYGPGEPLFRLVKVRATATEATEQFTLHYNYAGTDTACEWLFDDPHTFEIYHHADGALGVNITSFGLEGHFVSSAPQTAYAGSPMGTITYSGYGVFSAPTIVNSPEGLRSTIIPKRRLPNRREVSRRMFTPSQELVFSGDRDPKAGQIREDYDNPYIEPDIFDRADDPNLGDDWTALIRVGAGWYIHDNKAECSGTGIERWIRYPQHTDLYIAAPVTVSDNNARVGFITRHEYYAGKTITLPTLICYMLELVQTGANSANLVTSIMYKGTQTVLDTTALSAYTAGDSYYLFWDIQNTNLVGYVYPYPAFTPILATSSVTDSNLPKPGRVGITGLTGGPAEVVTMDSFLVLANFPTGVS